MGPGEADHDHEGGRARRTHEDEQRSLKIAIAITVGIMALEIAGGLISNSLSLFSDALHMFTDASALALCYLAGEMARRPPTADKTFGYYRVEVLSAFVNGVTLVGAAAYIFYEAGRRLLVPAEVEGLGMLIVTVIGLAANLLAMTVLERSMLGLNVRSAFLHILGDALSSVGVLIAAVIIFFTRWYIVDPIMSIAVGVVIIYGTGRMLREVLHILMEGVPSKISLEEVKDTIMSVPGIVEVHDLHIWSITSYMHSLTAHVVVRREEMENLNEILNGVKKEIEERYGIRHTTIQVEAEDYEEIGVVHGNGG